MDLADSAVNHFEALAAASAQLRAQEFTVFTHRYDMLSFGSFILEVGHPKRRLKFVWDGKDSQLQVSVSDFANQTSQPVWKELTVLNAASSLAFESILRVCRQELGS